MDTGQELARLKKELQLAWAKALDRPVQRLLLLRSLFHSIHQLINIHMASPEQESSQESLRDELSELHGALSRWPLKQLAHPLPLLKQSLELESDPLKLVFSSGAAAPEGRSPLTALPAVLLQPGREWEALVYLLALHCGWQPKRLPVKLDRPEQIQNWLEQSRTATDSSAVLALERDPQSPGSWWVHSVVKP
jgi:hypothetical protein